MKTCIASLFSACALMAQTSAPLAFEVASIKPAEPQSMNNIRVGMSADAGRVAFTYVTLRDLLTRAYEVKSPQISGPGWIDSDRFDVNAKIPEGVSREQVPVMLRTLLEERFQLKLKRENKEMPVYEMVVAKGGPKMDKAAESTGRARMSMEGHGDGVMNASVSSATMSNFADMLGRWVDRPVVDKTGLADAYDFKLELAMEDMARAKGAVIMHGPMAAASSSGGPAPEGAPSGSLFSSLQKLGLKLEAKKAPLDLLIVEKAERVPLEN